MTPSNGTSSPPTKTVWSLAKGELGVVEVEVEEEDFVGELESKFASALASVRWKGLLVMNLGRGLGKGGEFEVKNLGEDEREHFEANMAPQGA